MHIFQCTAVFCLHIVVINYCIVIEYFKCVHFSKMRVTDFCLTANHGDNFASSQIIMRRNCTQYIYLIMEFRPSCRLKLFSHRSTNTKRPFVFYSVMILSRQKKSCAKKHLLHFCKKIINFVHFVSNIDRVQQTLISRKYIKK